MSGNQFANENVVGVVGIGLMGTSIICALLLSGHRVVAIAPIKQDLDAAPRRISDQLNHCTEAGFLQGTVEGYLSRLKISSDYQLLEECSLVLECVIEKQEIKKGIYEKIETCVSFQTIIASNTSAIPISALQQLLKIPKRFIGIHWAEPAYATRFLEITCGMHTSVQTTEKAREFAAGWNKEPTVLKKDIMGFVTNRLMYAVYREAFSILENKQASMEDIDKAFRYDAGSWISLMGLFRRMDFTGIKDHAVVFEKLFPLLCNKQHVPTSMQDLVNQEAKGIHNLCGLYEYTPETAKKWEALFSKFNKDIYVLAEKYPSDLVSKL